MNKNIFCPPHRSLSADVLSFPVIPRSLDLNGGSCHLLRNSLSGLLSGDSGKKKHTAWGAHKRGHLAIISSQSQIDTQYKNIFLVKKNGGLWESAGEWDRWGGERPGERDGEMGEGGVTVPRQREIIFTAGASVIESFKIEIELNQSKVAGARRRGEVSWKDKRKKKGEKKTGR